MTKTPIVQSAEEGAYPCLMCATKDGLDERALYGPTGRLQFVGPDGKGTLNAHAYDKPVMEKLWSLSEQAASLKWGL